MSLHSREMCALFGCVRDKNVEGNTPRNDENLPGNISEKKLKFQHSPVQSDGH